MCPTIYYERIRKVDKIQMYTLETKIIIKKGGIKVKKVSDKK